MKPVASSSGAAQYCRSMATAEKTWRAFVPRGRQRGRGAKRGKKESEARQSCQSALWRYLDTSAGRLAPN